MNKIWIKLASLSGLTLFIWLSITLLVHNMASIVSVVDDSEYLINVFNQLKNAEVSVPLWIPIIFGGIFCCIKWKLEWRGRLIISGIAVLITVIFFSLYFTKVNTIPLGVAFKIIINLLSGGVLEGL